MPLYMDRHDLPGATAADVARAHASDVAVSGQHGVHFLSYWFDAENGSVFCLAKAPSSEDVQSVHAQSHGSIANEVITVSEQDVLRFLGQVHEPTDASEITRAFRVILFTDLEGSTSLLDGLGESAYMILLTEHDLIIRRALATWRGREVKHTGDGLMISFEEVGNALGCALEIQARFAERAGQPGTIELRVRIGMSAGEPVYRDNDIFGRAVNLAARACAAASGTETLVTDEVRMHPAAASFTFGAPTALELRGFGEPVQVSRLLAQRD
jgi:class 3 adenylate cyclase